VALHVYVTSPGNAPTLEQAESGHIELKFLPTFSEDVNDEKVGMESFRLYLWKEGRPNIHGLLADAVGASSGRMTVTGAPPSNSYKYLI